MGWQLGYVYGLTLAGDGVGNAVQKNDGSGDD